MISEEALRGEIVGYRFPPGSFTILDYEAWLTADSIVSPPLPYGVAHPMYIYYAAQGGMGISLDELFRLCHSSAEDGPMLGEAVIEQRRSLLVGEVLSVEGGITGLSRKSGRSGTFDIVTFELELLDQAGASVGSLTNAFIYPRRD